MSEKKLTKAEIVDNIFTKININKNNIQEIIDQFFEEIKKGITQDRIVELRGFGTFEVKLRKGRSDARNPKTGEIFPGENHGVAIFRPGQQLKKMVWNMRK